MAKDAIFKQKGSQHRKDLARGDGDFTNRRPG
jgi:hypothetical protein